jgi:hypothetical protein
MSRPVASLAGAGTALMLVCVLMLGGWLIMAAGASGPSGCGTSDLGGAVRPDLAALFSAAAARYDLGPGGPAILAGLTDVESGFGQNLGPSSAGAVGWTQFMPATWRRFGVDADGDGRKDPNSAPDAIFAAARYLRHLGAPGDWRRALFGYNHSRAYVDAVLAKADALTSAVTAPLDSVGCGAGMSPTLQAGVRKIVGGGRLVPIPGAPGELVDERIAPSVEYLMRRYHVKVTAGYAPTGHARGGEHPLGLAVDLQPAADGTWDEVDALAAWAEPEQNRPRPPFRWVGYNGDANHGRGNHLHLSWSHGPAPSRRPPAPWVEVFVVGP